MVKFRSLYNDPENRQIHGVVDTPTGPVTIFEPSSEDVRAIMGMQDIIAAFNQESDGDNTLDVSGMTILKEIIPLLTDLEMEEDLTDEEFAEIIENPSIELTDITTMLTDIVTHVYTLMIREFQSNLSLQTLAAMSEDVGDKTLGQYIVQASKTDDGRRQLNDINKQSKKIVELKEHQKDNEETPKEDKIDDTAPVLDPNNYTDSISKDLASRFSEMEEQREDK